MKSIPVLALCYGPTLPWKIYLKLFNLFQASFMVFTEVLFETPADCRLFLIRDPEGRVRTEGGKYVLPAPSWSARRGRGVMIINKDKLI